MRSARRRLRGAIVALAAAATPVACGGTIDNGAALGARPLLSLPEGNPARIELRRFEGKPRLALVSRDGDPSPALAAVFVTRAGPAMTTALAAIVEGRLRAAKLDVDVRVDRDAFRVRIAGSDGAQAAAFFAALAGAVSRPIATGSAEVALAGQRIASLKRNPLDAAELSPIAVCTGALGVAPGEALPDLATEAALRELEAVRRRALRATGAAIAAVGPHLYTVAAAQALERSSGWPDGPAPAAEQGPAADSLGVYVAPLLDRRSVRMSIAVRVPDPAIAAASAERLGAAEAPFLARLRELPEPWRAVQVSGVARTEGGCVGVVLEGAARGGATSIETSAAVAAGVAQREIAAAIAAGTGGGIAGRQVLTAADPREAASRAAWWALAGPGPAELRWATALGIGPGERGPREPGAALDGAKLRAEIERVTARASGAERRLGVERGQGELWLLLASPCGVAEEGAADAGLGALALLATVEARRRSADVALEPWISPDGMGVVAHAPFRDDRESPADLARRVADAAARALVATTPSADTLATARAAALDHLERSAGRQGAAMDAVAAALSPEHPSWVDPFGSFRRVVEATADGVKARAQALGTGPLRAAVIANGDAAQAAIAADAVDRWLTPTASPRVCRAGPGSASRAGRVEVRLPDGATLAQGLVAAPLPVPASPGLGPYAYRDLAELTAAALDGPGGMLASALSSAAATATARIAGGARAPSIIVDVRAPESSLSAAVADVRALLLRLPTAASDADLSRAAEILERREREGRADPRRRLVDLWSGRGPAPARASLLGWRAFLGAALREQALIVVEAKPR